MIKLGRLFRLLHLFTYIYCGLDRALAVTRTRRVQHEPQPEGRLGQSDTATDYSTFSYTREGPPTHVLDVQHPPSFGFAYSSLQPMDDRIMICSLPGEVKIAVLLHLDVESIAACKLVSHSNFSTKFHTIGPCFHSSHSVSTTDFRIRYRRHVAACAN